MHAEETPGADVPPPAGHEDPAEELAALAHGLARHLRRRTSLARRVLEPRATATSGTSPSSRSGAAPAGSATREPLTAAATPPLRSPAVPTAPAPSRAPSPTVPSAPTPHRPAPIPAAAAPAPESTDMSPKKAAPAAATRTSSTAASASTSPARSAADVKAQAAAAPDLETLRARVAACEACSLCKTRTQTVFQDGSGKRGVLFVGEAPGADEDRTGVPFVGRSGQLLTDIITKGMGIPREEVVIANVLKCRPPDNREPTAAEKAICTPWLDRQIELHDPQVIIPLGRHAAMHVLRVEAPMGAMRQKVHDVGTRKIVPTYHPSYLLRSPGEKKECWKDIQLAMAILGLPVSKGPTGA